ncbi:MAG: hypothetical protein ACLGIA_10825 [Actinomycetes bacterium]
MPLRRTGELPEDVRSRLSLERRERVLASAELVDGAWAVGTDRRLLVVDDAGVRVDRGWYEVDTASWDGEERVLSIFFVTGDSTWLTLAEGRDVRLPTLLRERVESSVVARHEVRVRGRGGARLVVRRVEGRLVLQTVLDPGTDPTDPEVAEALREGRAEITDMVGGLDP